MAGPNELIERNKMRLAALYRGEGTLEPAFVCKSPQISLFEGLGDYTLSDRPVQEWVPGIVENYQRQVRLLEAVGDDNVPCAFLKTGTHLYATAFGCRAHVFKDSNPCSVPLVTTPGQADGLDKPDIWKSPSLYRVFELAAAIQKALGKDIPLGSPDVQSGFDTACLIWNKQDLYCSMLDPAEKDSVKSLVGKCSLLLREFLTELRREYPTLNPCHCPGVWTPPEMGPWLSNDECGCIGVKEFEEFCLPELIEFSQAFGGMGMHCCADAEHQFESFKKIPGFYGFNRVAARRGYDTLLDHFVGLGSPVHVLAWVDDNSIERLIRRATTGTRFIFAKMGVPSLDEGRAWLDRMYAVAQR